MTPQIILLILLFPLTFIAGKIITKNSEEEIKEVRKITTIILKIIIATLSFLMLNTKLNTLTATIVTIMITIYLATHTKSPKEKVLIALIASTAIFFMIEEIIILALIAIFLKGINMQEIGEKLITKENTIQVTLLIVTISLKYVLINIFNHLILF